jgi:hypothetical protein
MNELCLYPASVSKSLLTVIGTLLVWSLPAMNDREKHRTAGINRSRDAWSTQRTRVAHASRRPRISINPCLPACLLPSTPEQRGTCGLTPRTSRLPVPAGVFHASAFLGFPLSANCTAQAVCPCQGSHRVQGQHRLCVKCPSSLCKRDGQP